MDWTTPHDFLEINIGIGGNLPAIPPVGGGRAPQATRLWISAIHASRIASKSGLQFYPGGLP
jgi:hypothetical protein